MIPLLSLGSLIAFTTPAEAQPPKAPQSSAQQGDTETARRAETLFNEGRDALAQGDTTVACSKFEESIGLVRAPGTVFNLAQCEEQRGRLLEAIRKWKDGVSLVPDDDDRVAPANERIAALEAKVPQLDVSLGDVPRKAEVRVNGDLIDRSALATPLRLNPGSYTVALSAPSRDPVSVKVQLAEGDRKKVELAFPVEPRTSPRRALGFAAGGLGLAALAVGGVTGIVILANDGDIDDECTPEGACSRQGYQDVESNRDLIAVNWISLGIGVVATGVGAYLLLTSPSEAQPAAPTTGIRAGNVAGGAGVSAWRQF